MYRIISCSCSVDISPYEATITATRSSLLSISASLFWDVYNYLTRYRGAGGRRWNERPVYLPARTRAPYKSRLYRAGPPQYEESSLGVNARAPRNHIRHEQTASPRRIYERGFTISSQRIVTAARMTRRKVSVSICSSGDRAGDQEIIVETRSLIIISPCRRSWWTRDARTSIDWPLWRKSSHTGCQNATALSLSRI